MDTLISPLTLIFGGCCSNVYTLEAILKHEASSGLLITFIQFIFVTAIAYRTQATRRLPFLKRPRIPLASLAVSASMFFTVNMLNNWAFAFNISVPVHIVLRSAVSVTTMAVGYWYGERYSRIKVLSVVMLTVGILISAISDAKAKGHNLGGTGTDVRGLLILLIAQLLSSTMGVYTQAMFKKHGHHWQENLFYSHLLSISLVLPFYPSLIRQYGHLRAHVPQALSHLALNGLTQYACITGVNMLSACCTAVEVSVVLNVRKLVSFLASVWLFGNKMTTGMMVGASVVFASGALYGWESRSAKSTTPSTMQKAKGHQKSD